MTIAEQEARTPSTSRIGLPEVSLIGPFLQP
jgi:hypothetical protein